MLDIYKETRGDVYPMWEWIVVVFALVALIAIGFAALQGHAERLPYEGQETSTR